jgi:hypothetical protein
LGAWSQNDYHDSLFVDVLGVDASTVEAMTVSLEGGIALAGDEDVQDFSRRAIPWPVRLEGSSEQGARGHRLAVLQPTVLWEYFKARAGPSFRVDSVRTTIVLRDRSTLTKAVALLWD